MDLGQLIRHGLNYFPFDSTAEQIAAYEAYIKCLNRWNKTYNLTGISDQEQMVSHHIMDSLAIVPMIDGDSIIDIGSGAGLPGIPLAVHFPDKRFTLLDSNGKKTRFITQACIELALHNVTVVQQRVQDFSSNQFDQAVCRAFAPLNVIARTCAHIIRSEGNLLAMKAGNEQLCSGSLLQVQNQIRLDVPLLRAERWVIRLQHQSGAES